MKKYLALLLALTAPFYPSIVSAEGNCTVNGQAVNCGEFASSGIGIFLIIVWLVSMVVGIVYFVFWIKMVIHAAKHEIPNKTMWIVLLLLVQISAVIYYFTVKRSFQEPTALPKSQV